MAIGTNDAATAASVDEIAPVKDHIPDCQTSSPKTPTENVLQSIEPLTVEERPVNPRTRIRTLAIVAALYMVLFIAALDQTIIA